MKNLGKYLLSAVIVLSLLYCIPVSAQDTVKKFHDSDNYFIRAGYSFPTKDKFNGGLSASLGATINLLNKLNLEAEGCLALPKSEFLRNESSDSIGAGDLTLISLNLNLDYYFISSDTFGVYLKAGTGFSFNEFSPASAYDDLGFTIEEDLDNSIQFIFGIGADFQFTDGIILNLDARYCLNSTDGTWITRDEISGAEVSGDSNADLNFITVMLGIRFN
jgi:outer membrane protein W